MPQISGVLVCVPGKRDRGLRFGLNQGRGCSAGGEGCDLYGTFFSFFVYGAGLHENGPAPLGQRMYLAQV